MKKLSRVFPLVILLLGFISCYARMNQVGAVDEKGLLPVLHPAEVIILCAAVLAAIVLAVCLFTGKYGRMISKLPWQAVGSAAAAVGLAGSSLLTPELDARVMVLHLIAAVCFGVIAYYRFRRAKAPLLPFAVNAVCLCAVCLFGQQQWGAKTQLQEYLFPALSGVLVALASVDWLRIEAGERCEKRAFFSRQAALFCSMTCLLSDQWLYYWGVCMWLFCLSCHTPYRMKLPAAVEKGIAMLENAGYQAYAVGGCVRDAQLGLTPNDYDICTNATPEQTAEVFKQYRQVHCGEKHGTVGVVIDETLYEITTFRKEGAYLDNRHPESVTFVRSLREDLARRDFTVNAMAYHSKRGYMDPYAGSQDLVDGVLRTVGSPRKRFEEDALRILRGMRFACRYRLKPEKKTKQAMEEMKARTDSLAAERVFSELNRCLPYMQWEDVIAYQPLLVQVIPELKATVNFQQYNSYHKYDVYTHTARVVGAVEADPALRWAALLHDVGKPETFCMDKKGQGHFYGHAQKSAEIAENVLKRLKAPTELREQVVFLILHHIDRIPPEKPALRKKLSKYGRENVEKLLQLQRADKSGTAYKKAGADYESAMKILEKLEKEEGRLQIRDLALNGNDLIEMGFTPGPELGQCQKWLLEMVLDEQIPNTKQALQEQAILILEEELR